MINASKKRMQIRESLKMPRDVSDIISEYAISSAELIHAYASLLDNTESFVVFLYESDGVEITQKYLGDFKYSLNVYSVWEKGIFIRDYTNHDDILGLIRDAEIKSVLRNIVEKMIDF